MQVMKFGGASVKNPESVKNVAAIIRQFAPTDHIVVVISAMDKTTNHLEQLAAAARENDAAETQVRFEKIKAFHMDIVHELFGKQPLDVHIELERYFSEVYRVIQGILLLGEFPPRTYDRIVAYGELISSCILSHYLRLDGLRVACPDARQIIRTDARHQQAEVIWPTTRENIVGKILPMFHEVQVVVVQGFIASSMDGKVTTLGREGSDYTASIFAHCLSAQSLIIWKDVAGVLNGDPRIEPHTRKLDELSYERAVEMTYYGATVIHPKTIRPLRNAGIPLLVKCFLDIEAEGTRIASAESVQQDDSICIRIQKKNQGLLRIVSRDFAFMDETHLSHIYQLVARSGLNVNLVQVTAIELCLVVNWMENAVREFESHLIEEYLVSHTQGMVLKTFINHDAEAWAMAKNASLMQRLDNKLLLLVPEG